MQDNLSIMEDLFDYRIADKSAINLYQYFEIQPIGLLSQCSFENLSRLHIEIGNDVCEHTEDGKTCKECDYSTPLYPLYAPITDDLIVNLLLFCSTDGLHLPLYYSDEESRKTIYEHVKLKCLKDDILKNKVRDLLIGNNQDWSGY